MTTSDCQMCEELRAENERLKRTLDGDPSQHATKEQREAWRFSAIKYSQKLESQLAEATKHVLAAEASEYRMIQERDAATKRGDDHNESLKKQAKYIHELTRRAETAEREREVVLEEAAQICEAIAKGLVGFVGGPGATARDCANAIRAAKKAGEK